MSKNHDGKSIVSGAFRKIRRAESGPDRLGVDIRYRDGGDPRIGMIRAWVNRRRGAVFGKGSREVWGAVVGKRTNGAFYGANFYPDITPDDIVQIIVADRLERGWFDMPIPDGVYPPDHPRAGQPRMNTGNLFRGIKFAVVLGLVAWYAKQTRGKGSGVRANSAGVRHGAKTRERYGRGVHADSVDTIDPSEWAETAELVTRTMAELNPTAREIIRSMVETPTKENAQTLAERFNLGVATIYRIRQGVYDRCRKLAGA